MDKKQKEALVIAMRENGKSYREITQELKLSPNTIKAILNKAGLDESTSQSSRAFELFSQGKTPLDVAIALSLKAEEALRYHQEYFMLLGCTDFTKVYLQVKDNPWPFVNLVNLTQNSGMGDVEILELLKIANGYLPRVRLEYDRLQAELNSLKAEITNSVRIYQDFCDRNLEMNKRINELQLIVDELEAKRTELKKSTIESNQHLAEFQEINTEMEQEIAKLMNQLSTPSPNSYHQNENEISLHHSQIEPSSRTLILDTKDLPPTNAQT